MSDAKQMKPFEHDNAYLSDAAGAAGTSHFAAADGLSLPYSLTIPSNCDGFVLRYIRFVDNLFPKRHSLRNLHGSLGNRIWTLRGWATWLLCTACLFALFGVAISTISWLWQDSQKATVKPALYLGFISFMWIIEQIFCVCMRPLIPLRAMQGYIRDWSFITGYVPKTMCAFALLVFAGNLIYGSFNVFSTLGFRDCIPSHPSSYSSIYVAIVNCSTPGISTSTQNSLISIVGSFGQDLSAKPAYSVFIFFLHLIATLAWTTTPLQFAVAMMPNVLELRSASDIIDDELLTTGNHTDPAESVLKRVHAHVVAADIGSCRCNEVFGIVIAGNMFLDLCLIAIQLSALQDPVYRQNSVLLPVTVFWMTASCVHMCAFLLPMAAYNSNLENIQGLLYRYSARLNGLTTPADNLAAWAKPLDSGLLKRLHDKVI
jgi:hypothetical protein